MITLGSLELRDGLVWEESSRPTNIVQEIKPTIGGSVRVYSAVMKQPNPITLVSLSDQGWQTYSVVKALRLMALDSASQFTLVMNGEIYQVSFRHYDPPVLEVNPLIPRTTPLDDDFFTIKLRLVAF